MKSRRKQKSKTTKDYIGFAACYKGQTIANARSFKTLVNKREVRNLLGNKDLVIKHTVPEGMIAVY
jgi:hypothetical protein